MSTNTDTANAALSASGIDPSLLGTTASSKSKFGLGTLSGETVNGVQALLNSLAGAKNVTAEQAVQAFASAANDPRDVDLVAALQQKLLLAGLYTDPKYTPRYGVIDPQDITAFSKLVTVGAQTGADLNAYLTAKASDGQYRGIAAAITSAQADVRQIKHANPLDLQSVLQAAYQKVNGTKATPEQIAGFVAAYDHSTTALQQQSYDQISAAKNVMPDTSASPALQAALGSQDPNTVPTPGSAASLRMADSADGTVNGRFNVDDLTRAISGQESGGNYNSVNKDSGAAGKYQIMPSSWPGMAQQAGLSPNAPQTPGNQELVARTVLASYVQKYGSVQAAAAAWYGGEGAAEKYVANPNDPYLNRKQGGGQYPSINEYIQQVTSRMFKNGANGGPVLFSTPPTVGATAMPPVTVDTTDPANAAVAAENYARNSNPGLAGAHDITGTFGDFLGLLSGHFGAGSNL